MARCRLARQPGVEIVVLPPLRPQANDREAIFDLMHKGGLPGLIFVTADLDATFERVRALGQVRAPP